MGNTTGHGDMKSAHEPSVLLEVEDVNKRTLGKLIIKTVGHEGTDTDEEGTYLRRQIQACISNLEHHKPALWKDARVSFYGLQGHEYVIQSGGGRHRFVVFLDAKDEVTLTKRK
ncbi:uncharacterized protein [Haliotis cracherodii]|uniref:uncharacterized protein n=1 Tax=Haliotis cracherodii TaxID=6455 RepID=UPI0039EA2997